MIKHKLNIFVLLIILVSLYPFPISAASSSVEQDMVIPLLSIQDGSGYFSNSPVSVQSNLYPADSDIQYATGKEIAVGNEVIDKRTETSKTIYLGKVGSDYKYKTLLYTGIIHYKDNYADNEEQWKDIDLTMVNGVVAKAPYTLTVDGLNVSVVDKKTGSAVNLSLDEVGETDTVKGTNATKIATPVLTKATTSVTKSNIATDTDLEISWGLSSVSYSRILKSANAPVTAKYNIAQTGNGLVVSAKAIDSKIDADKSVPVISSIKDGVLTETINTKTSNITYPIKIDPTVTVYYTSASDGETKHEGGTWAHNWAETTASTVYDALTAMELGQAGEGTNPVFRASVFFDTSDLPDTATISSGILSLYGFGDFSHVDFYITIQSGMPTYPHDPLVAGDYAKGNYTGDGGSLTTSGFNAAGYNNITLSTDGKSWINATGTTKFELRSNRDIAGTSPSDDEWVWIRTYEQGGGYIPFLELTYTVAEAATVETHTPATSVTNTTAIVEGHVTADGGASVTDRGICWSTSTNPTTASSHVHNGTGTGLFMGTLTSLTPGTTYHTKAFAINSVGTVYGSEVDLLTLPSEATSVTASENSATEVLVSWTVATGADNYHVYRGVTDLGEVGNVNHYHDTAAGAPLITAGSSVASDGTDSAHVDLSLSGTSVANGTTYSYTVKSQNASGDGSISSADNGYRLATALTYQWNRSAADSDASYGTIAGATSTTHADTGGAAPLITVGTTVATDGTTTTQVALSLSGTSVADGAGRYYTCTLVSTGASNTPATATANRGYRVATALTYQWQRSSGTGDSGYGDIGGATSSTYNDTAAPAPTVTAGTASASDGTFGSYVQLSDAGEAGNNGEARYYKCTLTSAGASNTPTSSVSNAGYRGTTTLGYQWWRSAADSDAAYSVISGGTTDPYNDTGAPADGTGRYFKTTISMTSATSANTTANRGYRTVGIPSVTTSNAESVGTSGATLKGIITDTTPDATKRGFAWGTTSNTTTPGSGQAPPATYASSNVTDGTYGASSFSDIRTGLTTSTTYYFRAAALNTAGWGWGDQKSFSTTNYLPEWSYHRPIVIAHTDTGAQTDYQFLLKIAENSTTPSGGVALNGHILSDFDDLRFTTSDGTTLLSYYVDNITGSTPNGLAYVWVKVDAIAAHPDDTTIYMHYGNNAAEAVSSAPDTLINYATGEVTNNINGERVNRFTSNSTLGVLAANTTFNYLVVGGGGGGGGFYAGAGGGAGGYRTNTTYTTTVGNKTVIVGTGGAGNGSNAGTGVSGKPSSFNAIEAAGGGGGGSYGANGVIGGSGGGGGGKDSGGPFVHGDGDTPDVSPDQGTAGGNGAVNYYYAGGGGGGATSAGGNAVGSTSGSDTSAGGTAGAGTANTISGSSVTYATGGVGRKWNGASGTAGTDYEGDGGSGGGGNSVGGAGGIGVVIVRYTFRNYTATEPTISSFGDEIGTNPEVTTQAASSVEETTATGNGNLVDDLGITITERGICYGLASAGNPTVASSKEAATGVGEGAFTASITGLTGGTAYHFAAYVIDNSAIASYGSVVDVLTKPSAPTNVVASDGTDTTKVVISWTASTSATDYEVMRATTSFGWVGNVTTVDDTVAAAPTITAGTVTASDATSTLYVELSGAGQGSTAGTTYAYTVKAKNATGNSTVSSSNDGYRGTTTLTYQWNRSAGDSDATYSDLAGATTNPFNDTDAPADGSGRYYKLTTSMTGATPVTTTANRGYRIATGYPSVTTGAATDIGATVARLNGNIVTTSPDSTQRGFAWGTTSNTTTPGSGQSAPATYTSNRTESGTFTAGAFDYYGTSFSAGTTYYYRAYAKNTVGWGWGDQVLFITKPAAPTGVSATDGTSTMNVTVTWTKSTGATGYRIYEGSNLLDTVGDVATFCDTTASAPTITAGTSSASDGTSIVHVVLSNAGEAGVNGTSRTYKVVATNTAGDSVDSSTDTGYRGTTTLAYAWQRSAADSNAGYSAIGGATTDPYNDTAAPSDGSGRYYKVTISMSGASDATSTVDRGYRAAVPTVTTSAATSVTDTTATLNGAIVITHPDSTQRGFAWSLTSNLTAPASTQSAPATYSNNYTTSGAYPDGSFTYDITSLTPGATYYYRAYSKNLAGWGWGDQVTLAMVPAAPTGVSATDGTSTTKVVITWNYSSGATGYKVYEGVNLLTTLGNVTTYDDFAAASPTISIGVITASDGTFTTHVVLTSIGETASNGAVRTYKVVATNAAGSSADSATDTGYRGTTTLTYQWLQSAADSDATYSAIGGGTTNPYNDTSAPADGSGRYYKLTISMVGATDQTTTADRGNRQAPPSITTGVCSGFTSYAAILNGMVTVQGSSAVSIYGFDYGLTTAYGSEIVVSGNTPNNINYWNNIVNLLPASVYHYRAKAFNGAWGYGNDASFSTKGSPVIYEYLNAGQDSNMTQIYGNNWGYMQFTVGSLSHSATSVNLYIKRVGLPSTVTVSLKHASGGLPTGNDLVSTTFDGDAISTSYLMYNFPIAETQLEQGMQYAIVVRAVAGDSSNYILWGTDAGGGLASAIAGSSINGGLSYTADATADGLFEIWGNPAIEVLSARVFTGYKVANDWVIIADVNNAYTPYYPNTDPQTTFQLQLIDGATIKASTTFKAWGRKPLSLYLNPTTANTMAWGSGYKIRIQSLATPAVYQEYTLVSTDWNAGSLLYLDGYIVNLASVYETYTGLSYLINTASGGRVLNIDGGTVFVQGIPDLNIVRKSLFETSTAVNQITANVPTHAGDSSIVWSDQVGPKVAAILTEGGSFVGIGGKDTLNYLFLMIAVVLAIILGAGGNFGGAMLASLPIIGIDIWLGGFSIEDAAAIALIAIFLIIRAIIWNNSAS